MTTVTHAAVVKRLLRPHRWHIAVCPCGWEGKPCSTPAGAEKWAVNHNRRNR